MESVIVKNRATPLRVSLLRRIVALLLLVSAAILLATYFGAQARMHRLSKVLTDQTLSHTETELQAFFTPIDRGLQMLNAWGEGGLIDLDDPLQVEQMLVPFLKRFPQISSALVADGVGRELMLLHVGDTWTIRRTDLEEWGEEKHFTRWTEGAEDRVETVEMKEYDPRGRPWYLGALTLRSAIVEGGDPTRPPIFWTDPYIFFTTKEPGLTASTLVLDDVVVDEDVESAGAAEVKLVIAFDLLLGAITDHTRDLQVGERGMVFVCTDDDRVIGLPRDEKFDDPGTVSACLLQKPSELEIPVIDAAVEAFQELEVGDLEDPQRFSADGEAWWVKYRPFHVDAENTLQIGVLVPERELLGNLAQIRGLILFITVAALVVSVIQAMSLSKRFSRPIEQLVVEADRIRQGDFSVGNSTIESEVAEIGQLATAVDRMRGGLESLFKIERELEVARHIQQSTFPEALPELADFSIAAWSESAEQTGGDTYDVVGIRQQVLGGDDEGSGQILITTEDCERVIFLLADATGHGIGPALSATQVRAMLRMAIRMGEDLNQIVHLMNVQLCEDLPSGRFVTAWFGDLDVASGRLKTISAGQGPLLYLEGSSGEVEVTGADELPMGIDIGSGGGIEANELMLEVGDVYAVFSDGFFESAGDERELFGNDRVIEILKANRSESTEVILDAVQRAMGEFTKHAPADDDRTAVIIKRIGV